ncbi:DUF721 domain-containing protein [Aureimonas leprariae]|uniref:DUF721 domain-containing protein n=1 Tax=Plantimonas leprariae TaxID=2615207 RepID=A0A7V7TW92_9HYPH|nr:DciA family protein [Aureimonas leprariae]KAB0679560.1 DUF721 domain-containing protein [Aureimonas leprariae]
MKKPFVPPQPVGEAVSALLDPVLRRKAGMTIGLLDAWPEIVGARLEAVTRPEKLVWPPETGAKDARLRPAVLVVACESAAALRLQHESGEIVQRINVFFGYRAVDRLRILQKPVAVTRPSRKPSLRGLSEAEEEALKAMTERIEDPKLKAALLAYGESILRRQTMTKP